eukprot:jgi/Bigna1/127035/aug1.3_g1743
MTAEEDLKLLHQEIASFLQRDEKKRPPPFSAESSSGNVYQWVSIVVNDAKRELTSSRIVRWGFRLLFSLTPPKINAKRQAKVHPILQLVIKYMCEMLPEALNSATKTTTTIPEGSDKLRTTFKDAFLRPGLDSGECLRLVLADDDSTDLYRSRSGSLWRWFYILAIHSPKEMVELLLATIKHENTVCAMEEEEGEEEDIKGERRKQVETPFGISK